MKKIERKDYMNTLIGLRDKNLLNHFKTFNLAFFYINFGVV